MKELVQAMREKGVGIGEDIVKVEMFLNHRLDTELLVKMGQAFAEAFAEEKPDIVLTVEASGIASAVTTAIALGNLPVVFAKKDKSGNISDKVYSSRVESFTKKNVYDAVVSKEYLGKEDKVLVIDDFLAKGNALNGLIDIINQSGAELIGCAIAIEKGFQGGGDELREKGYRIDSLAIIESMSDTSLAFRK